MIQPTTSLASVQQDFVSSASKLFIFFGGIQGQVGMAPFEFYRSSDILDCSRLFLRDLSQSWYQRGLPGIGNDAFAIGRFLDERIAASGAADICFVGNSMGGFAALLFCAMTGRGRVIAFAPQTFISRAARMRHGDTRWARQIETLHAARQPGAIQELRPWILDRFPKIQADIYVSRRDRLDLAHTQELADLQNCKVHVEEEGGHNLVRQLRDDGKLARILADKALAHNAPD